MKKQLFIHTFGCQMNVHDSSQIIALLSKHGYEEVNHAENAALIILNTCSIREKAAQKIMSQLGRYKPLKEKNERLIIGIGGCLAQHMGKELLAKVPYLDLVFGTHNIHKLPDFIDKIEKTGRRIADTSQQDVIPSISMCVDPPKGAVSSFVTIMQGCNNYCAYCVVPYLRGPETSRPSDEIISEVKGLVKCGIKEVTLLGQNVNSYGKTLHDGIRFPEILYKLNDIDGLERIRFTTSHPKDLSDELIRCFADVPALCEHIHLPVQSGSDSVLKAMNRVYTMKEYLERIDKLRAYRPDIAVTSDVIVGFPGETEDDFQASLDMMDKIRFDNLFSFKYSEREGTAAVKFENKVPEKVKSERLVILQALQEVHTQEKNQSAVGRTMDVLVDGRSKNSADDVSGRTRCNKIVNFRGSEALLGKSVSVRIKKAFLHSLRGEIVA